MKIGIINERTLSDFAILGGAMIRNFPAPVTAATGIDALCHAVACYTSLKVNPFSDLFAPVRTKKSGRRRRYWKRQAGG